jgi:hypothetical protein
VLLLGQLAPTLAHATLDACKGVSGTGAAECTTVPQKLTPWKYQIYGPLRSTPAMDTLDQALTEYRSNIVAHIGNSLCSSPTQTLGSVQVTNSSWNFGKLALNQRIPVKFTYGVWLQGGNPLVAHYECSPRSIDTTVAITRQGVCGYSQGWTYGGDDARSLYCIRSEAFEDRTCPTANPVLPGSGVKVLDSTDYQGAGAHPLQFARTYRSRRARADIAASMGGRASSVGRTGWLHSWERQIADVPYAPVALRRAIRPDGSVNTFSATPPDAQGAVQWQPEPGVRDRLLRTATGWDYRVFADDSLERYDAAGRLLAVIERNGWTTTLSYSDATMPVEVAPSRGC